MGKRIIAIVAAVSLAWTAVVAVVLWPPEDDSPGDEPVLTSTVVASGLPENHDEESLGIGTTLTPQPQSEAGPSTPVQPEPAPGQFAVDAAVAPLPVQPRLKQPPTAGVLFDVDSGEVLWARRPSLQLPIASLTKMMTALIIAEEHEPAERVLISAKAPHVEGSRIGVLKTGRKVPLRGLFLGLLLVSGNDAAVALAEHDAGSVGAFVTKMNARAAALGLGCSRFAGPAGLQDTGNSSCAYDLAALARADLADDWISSVTARRSATVPFPIKGGRLDLANNHYFAQHGIAGVPGARVTGLKTGLTNGAGRCYVTTARLGDTHLGVVLLDSPDPLRQVPQLLRAGFQRAAP